MRRSTGLGMWMAIMDMSGKTIANGLKLTAMATTGRPRWTTMKASRPSRRRSWMRPTRPTRQRREPYQRANGQSRGLYPTP